MSNTTTNDMTALRAELFATLRGLKDKTVDLDTARAVNDVAKTLVDTAKVEVDYIRASGGGESTFLDGATGNGNLPPGITTSVVHRIKG
ncbi:MAG: hypothetical protein RLY71_2814 [Pseudomonadota bacterium]|jgi:hypothetical protein